MIQRSHSTRTVAIAATIMVTCLSGSPRARDTEGTVTNRSGFDVVIGGDCSFARGVAALARKDGWTTLLGDSAHTLASADLAIVNLESPLAPCLPGSSTNRPRLCGDVRAVEALTAAGVDAVTLANNHALDAGVEGLEITARTLRDHGIVPLGVSAARTGMPKAETLGHIAVIAANIMPAAHPPGSEVPVPAPPQVATAVRNSRQRDPARPILVLLHLGREMDTSTQPRDVAFASAAVKAGASAVVMHGAHVLRSAAKYRDVPVHFGLGNLLFDQRDLRARRGALLSLHFVGNAPAEVTSVNCVDPLSTRTVSCESKLD